MRWIVLALGLMVTPWLLAACFIEDVFGGNEWLLLVDEILELRHEVH
jgi:hypothetical protein